MSKKSVANVQFPAITICDESDGKWSAMISALDFYDTSGKVFEVARNFDIWTIRRKRPDLTVVPNFDNIYDFVLLKTDEYSQVMLTDGNISALTTKDFHITVADEPLEVEKELLSVLM